MYFESARNQGLTVCADPCWWIFRDETRREDHWTSLAGSFSPRIWKPNSCFIALASWIADSFVITKNLFRKRGRALKLGEARLIANRWFTFAA
jgi:hypothetical protein